MTTTPTTEERIASLETNVKALEALEPTGGYPAPSEGYRWIPYFTSRWATWGLPILGLLGGLVGAIRFTRALQPATGTEWSQVVLTNVYLMDIALVFLGLGLGLVLSEAHRLEAIKPEGGGIKGKALDADSIGKVVELFKGVTAGRLILAIGFILLLSNAYLAKA